MRFHFRIRLAWILMAGLLVQAVAILVYTLNSDTLNRPSAEAYPYRLELETARSYPGTILLDRPFFDPDTTHGIVLYRHLGLTEIEFHDRQGRVQEQTRVAGNVKLSNSYWTDDVDGDGQQEFLYVRCWPYDAVALGGTAFLDSVWLCLLDDEMEERVVQRFSHADLDRIFRRDDSMPYRDVVFASEASGHFGERALHPRLRAIHVNANLEQSFSRAVLFFRQGEDVSLPDLYATTEVAVISRPGVWWDDPDGRPLYVFGGSPPANGIQFPVPLVTGEHVLLRGDQRTVMCVDSNGVFQWVRTYGEGFGSANVYPSDEDGRAIVHAMDSNRTWVNLELVNIATGKPVQSYRWEDSALRLFRGPVGHQHGWLGMLLNQAEEVYTVLDHRLQTITRVHPPRHEFFHQQAYDVLALPNGEPAIITLAASGTVTLTQPGTGKELAREQLKPLQQPKSIGVYASPPGEDDVAGILYARSGSYLLKLVSNPTPLWWLWRYRWAVLFCLLPITLTFGVYFLALYLRGRANAMARLLRQRDHYRDLERRHREKLSSVHQREEEANAKASKADAVQRAADRKIEQAKRELDLKNRHLEAVLGATDEGLAELDPEGRVLDANSSFCKLVNRSRSAVRGQPVGGLLGLRDNGWAKAFTLQPEALKLSEPLHAVSELEDPFSGQRVRKLFRLTLRPYEVGSGDMRQLLVIHGDISSLAVNGSGVVEPLPGLVTQAKSMQPVIAEIHQAIRSDMIVLLTGETGTGKTMVSRLIHEHHRTGKPFVEVNLANVQPNLFEGLFFGNVKGSFTGATGAKGHYHAANGGTLLLDDFLEADPVCQAKLLQVVETNEFRRVGGNPERVDVRHIVATNRNIEEDLRAGTIRADLYHRLNGIAIHLPPLRERGGDIPLLTRHFANEAAKKTGRDDIRIADSLLEAMQRYEWEGNVRELYLAIKYAVSNADEPVLRLKHFSARMQSKLQRAEPEENEPAATSNERDRLRAVLDEHGWVVTRAAKALGITRQALHKRMRRHDLKRPERAGRTG